MKKIILSLIVCLPFFVQAQEADQYEYLEKINAMRKLHFMIGTWVGEGWYNDQKGETHYFTQFEQITSKLNGLILEINGIGLDKNNSDTIHLAFAWFSYDPEKKEYRMDSHLADGKSTVAKAWFEEDRFFWGFKPNPQVEIRYELSWPKREIWNEIGKMKVGESDWKQFYSSTLSKK